LVVGAVLEGVGRQLTDLVERGKMYDRLYAVSLDEFCD